MTKRSKCKNWNADRWITFAAAFIAFVALGFSIWQGKLAQEHNEYSVRPLVIIDDAIDETGSGWRIVNYGLGPAQVKWFKVSIDGKDIHYWGDLKKEFNLLGENNKFFNPSKKTVIKSSGRH